jgi:hypothetical protein
MLHVHGHGKGHAACLRSCPSYMNNCMLHIHVHAACPCPCCMPVSLLLVRVHANVHMFVPMSIASMETDMQHGQERTCSIYTDMQHGHWHVAWTLTCSIDILYTRTNRMYIDMQQWLGLAAWALTCSIDKIIQNGHGHTAWTCSNMDIDTDYYWPGMDSRKLILWRFYRRVSEN